MKKLLFLSLPFLISCSGNILSDVASKSNDSDFLFQAQQLVNAESFDAAITLITTKMSAAGQAEVAARETLASAYGGQCGLIFMNYVNALSTATSTSAMTILKTPFVGTAVNPTACRSALTTMDAIGTFSQRTTNQNFFTAILGMVLMGSAARGYVDTIPPVGDGTNDVNICTGVTNTQLDDIIIGFGYMSQNFSAVSSSSIGSGSMTALTEITTACQAVGGASCIITDPAQITTQVRDFFRDLTNSKEYGVGTFVTGGNPALIPGSCP